MKNTQNTKSRVFGIIGMIGLVFVGMIIGYIINGSDHINRSTMSKGDCNAIANRIIEAAGGGAFNKPANPDLIAQLNKVYSENVLIVFLKNQNRNQKLKNLKSQKQHVERLNCY